MKKSFILLGMAVVWAACTREPAPAGSPVDTSFTASLADGVRTTLEGAKVLWNEGDAITILWGTSSSDQTLSTAASAGATTCFNAQVGTASTYYAVYPAAGTNAALTEEDGLYINVSKNQHGSFDTANIAVARTTEDSRVFAFKNLCALAKVSLGRDDVTEIRIRGNGQDDYLAGDALVDFATDGTPSFTLGETKRVEMVLTPSTGASFAPGEYYIGVLPGTLEQGIRFTCKVSSGVTLPVKNTDKKVEFKRSRILNFGIVDDLSPQQTDYYVTVDGAGKKDGSSWADALGLDEFRNLVKADAETVGERAERLNGSTFFFAGGKYVLADPETKYLQMDFNGHSSAVSIRFEGGYDPETGNRTQETIFSGDGQYAILSIQQRTNFTFYGITFADALAQADKSIKRSRTALYVDASTSTVTLDHCLFRDNVESQLAGKDYQGGAAIRLVAGNVRVSCCHFSSNKAISRGAVLKTSNDNGNIFFNRCSFVGNQLTGEGIGSVAFIQKGSVGICNSSSSGNGTSESGKDDTMINVSTGNLILVSNTFIESVTKGTRGTVRWESGAGSGGYKGLFANNVLVSYGSVANGAIFQQGGVISAGGNVFMDNAKSTTEGFFNLAASDLKLKWSQNSSSFQFDDAQWVWTHGGTLSAERTPVSSDAIESALNALETTVGLKTFGPDFLVWLSSDDSLLLDQLGNPRRNPDALRAGAYEGE